MLSVPNTVFKLNFPNHCIFFLTLLAAEPFILGFVHKCFFYFLVGVFTQSWKTGSLRMEVLLGVGNGVEDWGQNHFLLDPPRKAFNVVTVRNMIVNIAPCYRKCQPPGSCGPGDRTAHWTAFSPHTQSPSIPNPRKEQGFTQASVTGEHLSCQQPLFYCSPKTWRNPCVSAKFSLWDLFVDNDAKAKVGWKCLSWWNSCNQSNLTEFRLARA